MNKNLIWSLVILNSWIIVPAIVALIFGILAVAVVGILVYCFFDFLKFIFRKRKKRKDHNVIEETKFDRDLKKWQLS